MKIFLLWPVEISFSNRLYLRNGASWTPQTLQGQDHNFRSSIQIRWQNFKIRFNKKVRNFFQIFLTFFLLNFCLGLGKYYKDMSKKFSTIRSSVIEIFFQYPYFRSSFRIWVQNFKIRKIIKFFKFFPYFFKIFFNFFLFFFKFF